MTQTVFYLVWNPNGRSPLYRHDTLISAYQEAKRLALLNPGQEFFTLKAMAKYERAEPITITVLDGAEDDEIPF